MEFFFWKYRKHGGTISDEFVSIFQLNYSILKFILIVNGLFVKKNSFDQKFGELHVSGPWPNNTTAKFDDIQLTDELRKLDGRIIDCIYVDNQWVFQKLRNDRKHPNVRQAAEGNNNQQLLMFP